MALISCNGVVFKCAPGYQFDEHPNTAEGNPAFELPPGMEKFFATWDGEPVNGHVLLDLKGELLVEKLRATDSDEDLSGADLASSSTGSVPNISGAVEPEEDLIVGKSTQECLAFEEEGKASAVGAQVEVVDDDKIKKKPYPARGRKRDSSTIAKLQAVVAVNPYKYATKKEQGTAWEEVTKMAFYGMTEGDRKKREAGIVDLTKDTHNLKQLVNRQIDNHTKTFSARGTGDEEEQEDEHDVLVSQIRDYVKQGSTVAPKVSTLKNDTARYKAGELQRLQALTRTTLGMSTGNMKTNIMASFDDGLDTRVVRDDDNPEISFVASVAARGRMLEKGEIKVQDGPCGSANVLPVVEKAQVFKGAHDVQQSAEVNPGLPGSQTSRDAGLLSAGKGSRGPYRLKSRASNENQSPDGRTRKAARSQLGDHMGQLVSTMQCSATSEKAEQEQRRMAREEARVRDPLEREEARQRDKLDRKERRQRHRDKMKLRRAEQVQSAENQENMLSLMSTLISALTKKTGE